MTNDNEVDWRTRYDIQVAGQTAALREVNFGPAFDVGGGSFGFGGTRMATCQTCGAACKIESADPDDLEAAAAQPVYLHFKWHEVSR